MEPPQQVYSPLRQGDCPHLGPQSPGPEFSGPASAHHLFSQQLLTQWQLALNCCLLPSHSPGGPSTPLAAPSFSFIGFSSQHRHVGLAWGPVFRPLISLTPQWADLATWIYIFLLIPIISKWEMPSWPTPKLQMHITNSMVNISCCHIKLYIGNPLN